MAIRQLNKVQLAVVVEMLNKTSNDDDYTFDAQFAAAEMYQEAFRALHFSQPLSAAFWRNAEHQDFIKEPETLAAALHYNCDNIIDLALTMAGDVLNRAAAVLR